VRIYNLKAYSEKHGSRRLLQHHQRSDCVVKDGARMKSEYEKFEDTVKTLMKIPHSVVKAKLDEEKAAKKKTKRNKVKRNGS
jgi:hypothetical protein